ncbi:16S rRNA (cytosine(1402)-N(4))-methyltransferase RsmH [bacterium]|nr:16S rRNA (cytosine(1402)-N(4))-methyltransferase RsmH [bacterium]
MNESAYHEPVLVREVLDHLITTDSGVYVDATLGGGGHAEAVLGRLGPKGRLFGLDRDAEAVSFSRSRLASYGSRAVLSQGEFASLDSAAASAGFSGADGILFDLGVSSRQLDSAGRGFSYRMDGPLDLRMDDRLPVTAAEIVNSLPERELADLIFRYGEERNSRRIARCIVRRRGRMRIGTTAELAETVRRAGAGPFPEKTLSRVFQALRMKVNDEPGQLAAGLDSAERLLRPGGRLVVISYHSLEDRAVKRFIRGPESPAPRWAPAPPARFRVLTRRAVMPSTEECETNPRSRSARLRAAEKTSDGKI